MHQRLAVVSSLVLTCATGTALAQTDLLPDIITTVSQLYDNRITVENGRRLLRLSNGTANIGIGKLYLYGSTVNQDGTRDVMQRIYRTDGSSWDRLAGKFIHHPTHGHIHFDDWAIYRLRERGPNNEVGQIVAEGEKTSFCILDLQVYDNSLPDFDPDGEFRNCGSTVQGLSVGWMDIYSKDLDGQWIDITDVPDGDYWLESTVDPVFHLLESDNTNNTTMVPVVVSQGSTILPDAYEPNSTFTEVDAREVGKPASPNLGPTGPLTTIPDLTLHVSGERDYYRIYLAGTGTPANYARVMYQGSPITLILYNSNKAQLGLPATGTNGITTLPLNNRPRGWYYVRGSTSTGSTTQNYTLEIKPPQSAPPVIQTTSPPEGNITLQHGVDTLPVTWTISDPDGDPTWVTIYLNTAPVLDGSQVLIPTTINTPGADGSAIVNSAYIEHGVYWVYCEATDGGVKVGSWSPGTVTFTEEHCEADFDHSGHVDTEDFDAFVVAFEVGEQDADFDSSGFVDFVDYIEFVLAFEAGC